MEQGDVVANPFQVGRAKGVSAPKQASSPELDRLKGALQKLGGNGFYAEIVSPDLFDLDFHQDEKRAAPMQVMSALNRPATVVIKKDVPWRKDPVVAQITFDERKQSPQLKATLLADQLEAYLGSVAPAGWKAW
jgi:hypothetical protein